MERAIQYFSDPERISKFVERINIGTILHLIVDDDFPMDILIELMFQERFKQYICTFAGNEYGYSGRFNHETVRMYVIFDRIYNNISDIRQIRKIIIKSFTSYITGQFLGYVE